MSTNEASGWHLDKRFPVALILALAIQLGGFVWMASQISFTVDDLQVRLNKLENERDNNRDRLSAIEGSLRQQTMTLQRIEALVERAFPRRFNNGKGL